MSQKSHLTLICIFRYLNALKNLALSLSGLQFWAFNSTVLPHSGGVGINTLERVRCPSTTVVLKEISFSRKINRELTV